MRHCDFYCQNSITFVEHYLFDHLLPANEGSGDPCIICTIVNRFSKTHPHHCLICSQPMSTTCPNWNHIHEDCNKMEPWLYSKTCLGLKTFQLGLPMKKARRAIPCWNCLLFKLFASATSQQVDGTILFLNVDTISCWNLHLTWKMCFFTSWKECATVFYLFTTLQSTLTWKSGNVTFTEFCALLEETIVSSIGSIPKHTRNWKRLWTTLSN
jgi:hypothetical protein